MTEGIKEKMEVKGKERNGKDGRRETEDQRQLPVKESRTRRKLFPPLFLRYFLPPFGYKPKMVLRKKICL